MARHHDAVERNRIEVLHAAEKASAPAGQQVTGSERAAAIGNVRPVQTAKKSSMIIGFVALVIVVIALAFCHGGAVADAPAGTASEDGTSARSRYAAALSYNVSYDRGAVLRSRGSRSDAVAIANGARSAGDREGADGTMDGYEGRPRRYSSTELERLKSAAVSETWADPGAAKLLEELGQVRPSTNEVTFYDFDDIFERMQRVVAREQHPVQTQWSTLAEAITRRDTVVVDQLLRDRTYRSNLDQVASREFMMNFSGLVSLWSRRQWSRETVAQKPTQSVDAERQRQAEVAKTIKEAELAGELPEPLRVTMGGYKWGATSATYVGEPENVKRTDDHQRFVTRLREVLGEEALYGQVLVHRIKQGENQGEIVNVMFKVGDEFICLEPGWISMWIDETPLSESYPTRVVSGKLINGKRVTRMFFRPRGAGSP